MILNHNSECSLTINLLKVNLVGLKAMLFATLIAVESAKLYSFLFPLLFDSVDAYCSHSHPCCCRYSLQRTRNHSYWDLLCLWSLCCTGGKTHFLRLFPILDFINFINMLGATRPFWECLTHPHVFAFFVCFEKLNYNPKLLQLKFFSIISNLKEGRTLYFLKHSHHGH